MTQIILSYEGKKKKTKRIRIYQVKKLKELSSSHEISVGLGKNRWSRNREEVLPTLWWKKVVANRDDDEHGDGPWERERKKKEKKKENFQNNEFWKLLPFEISHRPAQFPNEILKFANELTDRTNDVKICGRVRMMWQLS